MRTRRLIALFAFFSAIVGLAIASYAAILDSKQVILIPKEITYASHPGLPQEVQDQEATSYSFLFDGDTGTEHTSFADADVTANFDAPKQISEIRVFGGSSYSLTVQRLEDQTWVDVPGLVGLDLSGLSEEWHAFAPSAGSFSASNVRLRLQLTSGDSGLKEVAIWGVGSHRNFSGESSVRELIGDTPLPTGQMRELEAQISGGSKEGQITSQNSAIYTFDNPYKAEDIARAYLVYELRGGDHWMGVTRSINWQPARGGYIRSDESGNSSGWSWQIEPISANSLDEGDNQVTFSLLQGANKPYGVRNVSLYVEPVNGWSFINHVASNQTSSNNPISVVADGKTDAGWVIYSADGSGNTNPHIDAVFDRLVQLDELRIQLSAAVSGTAQFFVLRDGAWVDANLPILDAATLQQGWNTVPLNLDVSAQGLRLVFSGGTTGNASVGEIELKGSGVGALVDPPQIEVSFPKSGEYYSDTAYIRGFVRPTSNDSGQVQIVAGGKSVPHFNGEFEIAVSKAELNVPADQTDWQVEINAIYPDGKVVSKTIDLNTPKDLSGESLDVETAETIDTLPPGKAKKIVHDGAELDIAANALVAKTKFKVKSLRDIDLPALDPGMVNVTKGPRKGYRFLPHGEHFSKKVKVRIPYDLSKLPAGMSESDIRTFFFDNETGKWQVLEREKVDTAKAEIVSLTDHFTDMINGVVTVPDSPQAASFNPTQLKDIKAANPGAKVNVIEPPQANNMGDVRLSYPIEIPPGRVGLQPQLGLSYNSSGGNSWTGIGWDMPMQSIMADTRWGVPRYDAANESETYVLNGEQLTPVAHRGALVPRTAEKTFHARIEGQFRKFIRHGSNPTNYWWEVRDKNGTAFFYGGDPNSNGPVADSTLTDANGNIYKWALREIRDTNGNQVLYRCKRVNDVGVAGGSVQGSDLYLKSIFYTGHNGVQGPYEVKFTRDRELGEARRPDVMIDARGGFKKVTADLLRKIEVTFNGTPVRSYEFNYKEGAFRKTLLESVSQFGEDGALFNKHDFEYFDEARNGNGSYKGFGASQAWNPGSDNVSTGFFGRGDASAISGMEGSGKGGNIHIGISFIACDKGNSAITVGGRFGYNRSESDGILALVDLNGDGLQDKVFRKGNVVSYRANQSGPNGTTTFGPAKVVATLPAISLEKTKSSNGGAEAYIFVVQAGFNVSDSTTQSPIYFSDTNGDGLPDLVHNGTVLFNHINTSGDPTFQATSAPTPYPIGTGTIDTTDFLPDFTAMQDRENERFPLIDTVRRWKAPYDGTIQITGDVALIEDPSPQRANYATADGVRVAIQHEATELWTTNIGATDYAPKVPTGVNSITVAKDDIIYFRVGSVQDGAYDQVSWAPRIEYTSITSQLDENALDVSVYDISQDFVLAGLGGEIQMPFTGTIKIEGQLQKLAATTDSVRAELLQNGSVIASQDFAPGDVGSWTLNESINVTVTKDSNGQVTSADKFSLRVIVDSPIDMTKLVWNSAAPLRLYYTASPDINPITNQSGDPTVELPFSPSTDLYSDTDLAAPYQPWPSPKVQSYRVLPQIAIAPGNTTLNGDIILTIKSNGGLDAKHTISVVNGVANNGDFLFDAALNQDYYFTLTTRDATLASVISDKTVILREVDVNGDPILDTNNQPIDVTVPTEIRSPEPATIIGQAYRGWGTFGYDGNAPRDTQPISISSDDLSLANYDQAYFDALRQQIEDAANNQNPDMSLAQQFQFNIYPYFPDFQNARLKGPDDLTWATADTVSSSRNGPDDSSVPTLGEIVPTGARAPAKLSTTNQDGFLCRRLCVWWYF